MKTLKPVNQKSVFYSFDEIIRRFTHGEISAQKMKAAERALNAMTKTAIVDVQGDNFGIDFNVKEVYLAFSELYQKIMDNEIELEAADLLQSSLEGKVKAYIAQIIKAQYLKTLSRSQAKSIGMKDIEGDSENVTYKE